MQGARDWPVPACGTEMDKRGLSYGPVPDPSTLLHVNSDSPALLFRQVSLLCRQIWDGLHHESACGTWGTEKHGPGYQVSRGKSRLSRAKRFTGQI